MICPNCGTEGDGVFCAVCGAKLPARSELDMNPVSRRRAAEKAAEEAETMRRKYEEAAEAAKTMLLAAEAEETAAAKVRAEQEESLKKAITEAEALMSDKTARLSAAQTEQRAAERLLAERRTALADFQRTGRAPDSINTPAFSRWSASPESLSSESTRKTSEPVQDITRMKPEISILKQDSAWAQSDLLRQPPELPHITPNASYAQSGIQPSWNDTSSHMDTVQPVESKTWAAGQPAQNIVSPWATPPDPAPQWASGTDPSQAEIWNTIVKNTPHEPDAENVLRKAAGYWKDSTPLPADRMTDTKMQQTDPRFQQTDPRIQQINPRMQQMDPRLQQIDPRLQHTDPRLQQTDPRLQQTDPRLQQTDPRLQQTDPRIMQQTDNRTAPPDPWGLGNAGQAPWQINEQQQHAKQAENNPQVAFIPRASVKQREEKSRRPSKTNDDDFDEDNDAEYEEDEEDEDEKPSFFKGFFSGLKLTKSHKGKREDDDEEDDEEDDDYEDEDDDEDDEDEEDDEDDEGGHGSNLLRNVLIAIAVLIVIVALSFGIGKLIQRFMPGNTQSNTNAQSDNSTQPTPAAGDMESPLVVSQAPTASSTQVAGLAFGDPSSFTNIPASGISMAKEGRLVYCSADPAGVYLMNDDYTAPSTISDKQAYNAVYDPPWIYFSTEDGIYRVSQDDPGTLTQIISEVYDSPHVFYVFNNLLYYSHMDPDGIWNIDAVNLDSTDQNDRLIANVDYNFYMDSTGVYTFSDESVDHSDIQPLFAQPISPSQPADDSQQRKNVYFSSFTQNGTYLIGNLYMDKFVTSNDQGVIVQVTENTDMREYMLARDPTASDYASRKIFTGTDGAIYQLRYNDRGSYALSRQADTNSDNQIVADDIEPNVYTIYNNRLYYLTTTYGQDNAVFYKIMKYDTGSPDMAPAFVIDFGAYNQDMIGMAAKLDRNDTSFDKITTDNSGGDILYFAGMVIAADGSLTVYDRTNGTSFALNPDL